MNTEALFEETGLSLAILGMAVVFVALTILIMVINALPRIIGLMERRQRRGDIDDRKSASSGPPVPLAYAPSPTRAIRSDAALDADADDVLSPELIAVLTAAAEYELGPVRIVRTRPLTVSELAWTLEGRLRHHASHRLQTRNR